MARESARWLSEALLERTARRFVRSLVPVVGVAISGAASAWSVRRVTTLALRAPAEDEVLRLASDLVHGAPDDDGVGPPPPSELER